MGHDDAETELPLSMKCFTIIVSVFYMLVPVWSVSVKCSSLTIFSMQTESLFSVKDHEDLDESDESDDSDVSYMADSDSSINSSSCGYDDAEFHDDGMQDLLRDDVSSRNEGDTSKVDLPNVSGKNDICFIVDEAFEYM